jgi:hypothetical protein
MRLKEQRSIIVLAYEPVALISGVCKSAFLEIKDWGSEGYAFGGVDELATIDFVIFTPSIGIRKLYAGGCVFENCVLDCGSKGVFNPDRSVDQS